LLVSPAAPFPLRPGTVGDAAARAALSDNRRSGVVTSAVPRKNPGPETKRKSAIHRDSEKEISEVKAGINRKNIVT